MEHIDINGLTEAQKLELHSKLTYDLSRKKNERLYTPEVVALWDMMGAVLPLQRRMLLDVFAKSYSVNKFVDRAEVLDILVKKAVPNSNNTILLAAVRKVIGESVEMYLKRRNMTVNLVNLLNNLDLAEQCVDWRFPGYIRNGVLGKVISWNYEDRDQYATA